MKEIFISYRHADSLAEAGRLYSELIQRFGEGSVFLDQSGIQSGDDFPEALRLTVDGAEVFLAVIGPQWLAEFGKRATGHPVDYVLEEIAQALGRVDGAGRPALKIIPLLMHGAKMPTDPADLPERIRGLATLDAATLRVAVADYRSDIEDLCTLIEKHSGNLTARRQNAWLMGSLKDQKQSRADIGPDIAVLADSGQLIPRRAAIAAIDAWWAGWEKARRPFALLGDEGDGKSWAVAAWLAGKSQDGFAVPVVYVSATRVSAPDLKAILATALDKSLPTFSQQGWQATLGNYCAPDGRPMPRFLLVLDGLNERPSENWPRVLDDCLAPRWRECLAVMFICRTVYWDRHLEGYDEAVVRHVLPPYDERELQQVLHLAGQRKEVYPDDVLKLMSKPRLFKLAVRLAGEIKRGGATLERLVLEDWRDMTRHRASGEPMTHKEFLAWIRALVTQYEDSLEHADFAVRAQGYGDPKELKEEMLNADILREEEDGSLKVQKKPLLLGLGLLLAHEVKSATAQGEAAMQEQIDRRMGEAPDMDLRVRICGMAFLYALSLKDFPEMGLLALLRAWITGRNIEQGDLEEVAAYLPLRPETYLRMAEEVWGNLNNAEVQDVFMKGFLRFRTLPMVREKLIEAFTVWLGFVYLNGYRGYYERDAEKLAESRREVESLLGESPDRGATMNRFGYELVATENQSLMRLGQVAVAVISHETDRLPYCQALAAGMLVNAAMGGGCPAFGWVCRTADQQTQGELIQAARSLTEQQQPLAYAAARVMLNALGSESANRLCETIPSKFRPEYAAAQFRREHRCSSLWQADNYLDCLAAQQLTPAWIARQMQGLAVQPDISLPEAVVALLRDAGGGLALSNVAASSCRDREDIILEEIEPALCAYTPERYAQLMCDLAAELSRRDGQPRRMLAWFLYDYSPAWDAASREVIEAVWKSTYAVEDEENKWAELMLYPCVVFDRPAEEQLRFSREREAKRGYIVNQEPCIRPFVSEQLAWIDGFLAETTQDKLPEVLSHLRVSLPQLDAALRSRLLDIFEAGDTLIRGLCLAIFLHTRDEEAAHVVIGGGWQAPSDQNYEAYFGSRLLGLYGLSIPFAELATRISPELLGHALEQRGCKSDEVAAYAGLLDGIWRRLGDIEISPETEGRFVTIIEKRDTYAAFDSIDVRLSEPSDSRITNYTWGGSAGGSLDHFKLSMDPEARFQAESKAQSAFFDKVKAMHDAGNPWFANSFQHGHLDKVVTLPHSPWRTWFDAAIAADGKRIIFMCRAFYEKLCAVLLTHEPENGAVLFRVLRTHSALKVSSKNTRLPTLQVGLLAAENSAPVHALRNDMLEECSTDLALFELALLANRGGAESWLYGEINALRNSNHDYDRARAWMLEGFSLSSEGHELMQEFVQSGENSWVRGAAEIALQNRRRDSWARHWFGCFLAESDRVKAWAAFRLFLRCVDRRFWLWLPEMPLNDAELWKRDAYQAHRGEIFKATEKNEKAWQDTLVGHKVKPKELWPWMKDYATEMS